MSLFLQTATSPVRLQVLLAVFLCMSLPFCPCRPPQGVHAFTPGTTTSLLGRRSDQYVHVYAHVNAHVNVKVTVLRMGYTSPEASEALSSSAAVKQRPLLTPKIGDLVRYFDLDGGNARGEELVGKITFLTQTSSSSYIAELTQLEDMGEGYFAEYGSMKRMSKKSDRDILQVSPLAASFVRSEQAYKVPYNKATGKVVVRKEQYDLEGWEGPQAAAAAAVDRTVLEADGLKYEQLKFKILKHTGIAGLLGTALANIVKGTEDAVIYFAGAVASLGYLFFLSIKTDTMATDNRKLGANVSNLRFVMPVLVIVGVALYNQNLGDKANPILLANNNENPFGRVTTEQFAAAVLGFLTYRIPLFAGQLQEALKSESGDTVLPGSAGVAIQLAKAAKAQAQAEKDAAAVAVADLIPVLLVSGPQATGRDELVQQLLEQEKDRLVSPILIDRLADGATFDRLASRQEFLHVDETERFGWTKTGILQAASASASTSNGNSGSDEPQDAPPSKKVVVVNASVQLAKKLQTSLSGARLIGVWVGLDSVTEFERRLGQQIDDGLIPIEEGETRETVLRGRIKEIVQEIDYGLSSGIFEFTILNKDPGTSLKELKEAASYCFR